MKFDVEGTEVIFPYDHVYPEQYRYMLALHRALGATTTTTTSGADRRVPRAGACCVLEMPSGTGKTVSLLALIAALQAARPDVGKLVYCSRTVPEVEQTIEEARRVFAARQQQQRPADGGGGEARRSVLALAVSSRKNLCVNPAVCAMKDGGAVDSACRDLTASWVREAVLREREEEEGGEESGGDIEDARLCKFYEGFEKKGDALTLLSGVYSLSDLRRVGTEQGICPYFLARRLAALADVVVFSYNYLTDPHVASFVTKDFREDSIVVFDEAHNIDDACTEALSVSVTAASLEAASSSITKIVAEIAREKEAGGERLKREYARLVEELANSGVRSVADEVSIDPVLPDDVVKEVVPGSMRRAEHFAGLMRRIVDSLKARLASLRNVEIESPFALTRRVAQSAVIPEPEALRFASERLASLVRNLELREIASFKALFAVAELVTLAATYSRGFTVIAEPNSGPAVPGASSALLQLCCLDASIAFLPIVRRFRNVVLTSGTMSPLDMYPRILGFRPVLSERFSMTLSRPCALPMLVTRGADQVALTSRLAARDDPSVLRNYGSLLSELSAVVPDGIVCFFPSYAFLEQSVTAWYEMGLMANVVENKLVFVETPDPVESTLALHNYKVACDCGRGAVLLAVARGKLSEGIDFIHQYGRCVIVLGVPFQYTQSRALIARLEFLFSECGISESEFLTFDAMRAASQCLGRAIRGKSDYAVLVMADKRFARTDKRSKLPQWISQALTPGLISLSVDGATSLARTFYRKMGQPFPIEDQVGTSLWRLEDVQQFIAQTQHEQQNL